MKRYSREEMLKESGARPEELTNIEEKRLIVPNRSGWFSANREEYYTKQQVDLVKYIIQTRRMLETRRRQELTIAERLGLR